MPICLDPRVLIPVRLPSDADLLPEAQVTYYARPLTVSQRLHISAAIDQMADEALELTKRVDLQCEVLQMLLMEKEHAGQREPVTAQRLKDTLTPRELASLMYTALAAISLVEDDVKKFVSPPASQVASSAPTATKPEVAAALPANQPPSTSPACAATESQGTVQTVAKPAVELDAWA